MAIFRFNYQRAVFKITVRLLPKNAITAKKVKSEDGIGLL
jgi:hypothetical protein